MARSTTCAFLAFLALAPPAGAQQAPAATSGRPDGSARSPYAPAAAFVQAGRSSGADALTAGLLWPLRPPQELASGGWWSAQLEASLGRWASRRTDERGRTVSTQVGLMPSLRYRFAGLPSLFVEAGFGVNAIAPVFGNGGGRFSTVFNFGEQLGIGLRTADGALEWSLRYQHFSNGGFKKPNPGEDFVQLRLSLAL